MSDPQFQTNQNLLEAFSRESQSRNLYEFYAKTAKKEGYIQLSNYLSQFSQHKRSHAKSFLKLIKSKSVSTNVEVAPAVIGTTTENLESAAKRALEAHSHIYPRFSQSARKEKYIEAAVLFESIMKAEEYHETTLNDFLNNIRTDRIFKREKPVSWICVKCGFVHFAQNALEKCPGCGHPKAYFEILTLLP